MKDIKIVNSNIENIYDNIKNSGVNSSKKNLNSAGSNSTRKQSSLKKDNAYDKPMVTKSQVNNVNSASGAKRSGRKIAPKNDHSQNKKNSKILFEYEQEEFSSAGRVNQLSAPGSIDSSEPRRMQILQFNQSDGLPMPN